MTRAKDRKKKLEDALNQAESFHEDVNKFVAWLCETEKALTNLKPICRVLERVNCQIDSHKVSKFIIVCLM